MITKATTSAKECDFFFRIFAGVQQIKVETRGTIVSVMKVQVKFVLSTCNHVFETDLNHYIGTTLNLRSPISSDKEDLMNVIENKDKRKF